MLTKRQKEILDFIKFYTKKNDYSPTIEEIADHLGVSSVSTVHEHLENLKKKGYLRRQENQPRGIEILSLNPMIQITLLGEITAGQPVETYNHKEIISIPKSLISSSKKVFALRVVGNSMIDENINDGDIVLVRETDEVNNGDKVIALLNGETTLKKFYKGKEGIILYPANKNYRPIKLEKEDNLNIQGIVIDVIKSSQEEITLSSSTKTQNQITKAKSLQKPYYEKPGFRLYQANCLNVLASLPENSVDMIFADPPYNLSNGGFTVHAGRMVSVNKGNWDKSKGFEDDYNFHYKWIKACRRVLKPHGTLWVSGTYHSIYQCGHALQALGYHILNDVAWFKPNASPNLSCRYFTASHETLIWARKEKKAKHIFHYDLMKNGNWPEDKLKKPGLQMRSVWSMGTPRPVEKKFGKHPTQKPEDLLKRIMLASTNKGDLVVDPFTGSSTTGMAAYLYGRKFIGIDTEPKFLDLSIKRFKELCNNLKNKIVR